MKETKVAKANKCKEILGKGTINDEEKLFLFGLIKNHPDFYSKRGVGIKDFFIKKTAWGSMGFWILRNDNSETDFSYKQCLTPRTKLQEIKYACRTAIEDDILAHKILGVGYVAHHKNISFKEIFEEWIKDKKIEDLLLEDLRDNQVKIRFKDKAIAEDFRTFHNKLAEIEEISVEEHNKIHFGEKDD